MIKPQINNAKAPLHPVYGLRRGLQDRSSFEIVEPHLFFRHCATKVGNKIRGLQQSMPLIPINLAIAPGHTTSGVIAHLVKAGTVNKAGVLLETNLAERDLQNFFMNPSDEQLVFRSDFHEASKAFSFASPLAAHILSNHHEKATGSYIDWSRIRLIHMVEYLGVNPSSSFSFQNYLQRYFLDLLPRENRIPPENVVYIDQTDIEGHTEKIFHLGGIDIMMMGLGPNGHVWFNEPGSPFDCGMRIAHLSADTVTLKKLHNPCLSGDPRAITPGIREILEARHAFLFVSGDKAEITKASLFGPVTTEHPAAVIRLHPSADIILDFDAASQLGSGIKASIDKAMANVRKANHLIRKTGLDEGWNHAPMERLAKQLAGAYLDKTVPDDELERSILEFVSLKQRAVDFESFLNSISSFLLENIIEKHPGYPDNIPPAAEEAFRVILQIADQSPDIETFSYILSSYPMEDVLKHALDNLETVRQEVQDARPKSLLGMLARTVVKAAYVVRYIRANQQLEPVRSAIERLAHFAEELKHRPADIESFLHRLHSFIQRKALDHYLKNLDSIRTEVDERKDPHGIESLNRLSRRILKVFRFPEIRDMVAERKRLLFYMSYIDILSASIIPTASRQRRDVATDSIFEGALRSEADYIHQPAVEIIFEALAAGKKQGRVFYSLAFQPILMSSEKLPRFASALIDMLLRAKRNEVTLFISDTQEPGSNLLLTPEEFFESSKEEVVELASQSPKIRHDLTEHLLALMDDEQNEAVFARDMLMKLAALPI